ncbi:MAG: hypothetical protein ACTHJ0_10445 [Flavipsychrobacter sp.]
MNKTSAQIVWVYIYLGLISITFFFSILINCPFILTVTVIAALGIFSYRYIAKHSIPFNQPNKRELTLTYIIFFIALLIIANKTFYIEKKYGDWDAWLIWNYHGRFLAGKSWQQMFQLPSNYHSDYPLYIPGFLGFFWRLMGNTNILVSYAFSIFTTLAIPIIIFLELHQRNLLIASIVLLIFATDEFYLQHAIAQYADLPLGALLLCMLVCQYHAKDRPDNNVLAAALAGCCIWLKNEGLMIALIFIVFNLRSLFFNKQARKCIFIFGLFVIALVLFKAKSPANDMVNGAHQKIIENAFDWSRYQLIFNSFVFNFDHNFFALKIAIPLLAAYCIYIKKIPKDFIMMLTIMLAYFLVYLLLSDHLEWQLGTSLDRIILQLTPAFWYVIARQLSNIKISIAPENASIGQ